jgi:hypothetical protein
MGPARIVQRRNKTMESPKNIQRRSKVVAAAESRNEGAAKGDRKADKDRTGPARDEASQIADNKTGAAATT